MIPEEYHSSVNWKKVLDNYRRNYTYTEEWEITVIEIIANAIDAHANKINLSFTTEKDMPNKIKLICVDNGKGMDKNSFKEYHNLGSLTKDRTAGTIGFAGIGAKLCIDLCEKIYTETSDGTNILATEWYFNKEKNEPRYIFVPPKGGLASYSCDSGTYVEIINLPAKDFCEEKLKNVIIENYEFVLPPYGNVRIFVNNKEVRIEKPAVTNRRPVKKNKKIKKLNKYIDINGEFFLVDDKSSHVSKESIGGIKVVVCGKTILKDELFNKKEFIKPEYLYKISGYVRCDELIEITKTSKDDLNKKDALWWNFEHEIGKEFEKWLKEIDAWREITSSNDIDTDVFEEIAKNLTTLLRDVIKKFPDDFRNLPFFSKTTQSTVVEKPTGSEEGSVSNTGDVTTSGGTTQDSTTGDGGGTTGRSEGSVQTSGFDPDIEGINSDKNGDKKVTMAHQRTHGIRIFSINAETDKRAGWFDLSSGAFVINTAHPAYKIAIRKIEVLDMYVTHLFVEELLDNQGFEKNKKEEMKYEIYLAYFNQLR